MKLSAGDDDDLKAFFDRHNGRLGVPYEQAKGILKQFDVFVLSDERKIAVILVKDGEAHISGYGNEIVGLPAIRWAIEALKVKKTAVCNTFRAGHCLAKRLGFDEKRQDEKVTYYEMA